MEDGAWGSGCMPSYMYALYVRASSVERVGVLRTTGRPASRCRSELLIGCPPLRVLLAGLTPLYLCLSCSLVVLPPPLPPTFSAPWHPPVFLL